MKKAPGHGQVCVVAFDRDGGVYVYPMADAVAAHALAAQLRGSADMDRVGVAHPAVDCDGNPFWDGAEV